MRRALGVALAMAIAADLHAPAASAQATDRERAGVHFEAARRHVQAGRCDLALEEFRLSIDFEPTSVGARLNLGDCFVTLGRLPDAFRQYKEAEANAVARRDPRLETARRSAAEVEQKLVRILLREPEPVVAGLVVTVDGTSAGARPWLVAVTPGKPHALEATAPDGRRWRADVNGKAGDVLRVDVEMGTAPAPAGAGETPVVPRAPASSLGTWGLVVGAVGIAGVVTGAVSGALASSSRSDLAGIVNKDPQCSGIYPGARCEAGAQARIQPIQDRAYLESTVSTIAFVAGGVLLVSGIVMYVLAPSEPPSTRKGAPAGARLRIGAGGTLEGSF
jgi:hypothetical protein